MHRWTFLIAEGKFAKIFLFQGTHTTVSRRNEEKSFVFFPLAFLALGSTRFLKEKKAVFLHAKKHPVILAVLFYAAAISALPYMYVHKILLAIYIQPPYTRERYFTWQILQISKVPLREGENTIFSTFITACR